MDLFADDIDTSLYETSADRLRLLEQLVIANQQPAVLDELQGGFRFRAIGLDRSTLLQMRYAGVIEDSGIEMGRSIDWQLTDEGRHVVECVQNGIEIDIDEETIETVDRTLGTLSSLPTDDGFLARDYDLNSARVRSLHDRGLIERAESRPGCADVWQLSDFGADLLAFVVRGDLDE
jgi:hypothetical protein